MVLPEAARVRVAQHGGMCHRREHRKRDDEQRETGGSFTHKTLV